MGGSQTRGAERRRHGSGAQGRAFLRLGGQGTCGARTENMENMANLPVTRDVSKLSGWLKADAERNM